MVCYRTFQKQPAVQRISSVGTPAALAAKVAALLVLCGLKMLVSIPIFFMISFTYRDIVSFAAGP